MKLTRNVQGSRPTEPSVSKLAGLHSWLSRSSVVTAVNDIEKLSATPAPAGSVLARLLSGAPRLRSKLLLAR
ncbi:hypothetical protein OE88DRAFT_1666607 [Heliocybe sulcata]|uniref:Uncharacterized protein n=1 Tax=Heliocybe sulcata TaxID=5364 RepID=A0A5C3MPD9_9AGAM|nr:hypothetical protein OE88DRAFT_1666607 [Heliocybe sulcata]